jgi:uncharacterized protein (TIGR02996 family)
MAADEALEQAIARDPDDVASCLVYADWLQQRGDLRGELIMLQHRGETDAANALLRVHAKHFFGGLTERLGLVDVTWHLGFLRSCRFSLHADHGAGHEQRTLDALDVLLALPIARCIRELSIGVMNVPYNNYQRAIEVLARHDLGAVRRLALGENIDFPREVLAIEVGRLAPVFAAAPNLRSLVIRSTAEDVDLTGIDRLPLTELCVQGCRDTTVATILQAPLPDLVTLELEGSLRLADAGWRPLLDAARVPALRHLKLRVYTALADRAGALIANAPLLTQLRTLDLSETLMGEADIDAMLAHAPAFAHLERLHIGMLPFVLEPERATAVAALCPRVDL